MLYSWISSNNYKKQKRVLVSDLKKINKNIRDDELWKGRFECRLIGSPEKYVYEDKSGMQVYFTIAVIDKKTNRYVEKTDFVAAWHHFGGANISIFVNEAIVKRFDVWKENPRPSIKDTHDYSKEKIDFKKLERV